MTAAAHGLLLAAGAGRRMGTPKGLLRDADGLAWVERGVRALLDGGCDRVTVVVGAEAEAVSALVPRLHGVDTVYAAAWAEGMSASLVAGVAALTATQPGNTQEAPESNPKTTVAVVLLVDLPDVGDAVVHRVLSAAGDDDTTLARAAYGGRPGHPVVIGRAHWATVLAEADGDTGARDYLTAHGAQLIECGDLATGRDVDRPPSGQDPKSRE